MCDPARVRKRIAQSGSVTARSPWRVELGQLMLGSVGRQQLGKAAVLLAFTLPSLADAPFLTGSESWLHLASRERGGELNPAPTRELLGFYTFDRERAEGRILLTDLLCRATITVLPCFCRRHVLEL